MEPSRRTRLLALVAVAAAATGGLAAWAASPSSNRLAIRVPLERLSHPAPVPTTTTTGLPVATTTTTTTQPPPPPTTKPSTTTQAPTTTQPPVSTTTETTLPPPCSVPSSAVYGIDPNHGAATGGGSQLVTVVAPSASSESATLTAWDRDASGCWEPAAGPYRAETGYAGLVPLADRVSGDGTTPLGLYSLGPMIYGVSAADPSRRYPYHQLVCGDWWDELPGSPTYEDFEHVACGTQPAYASDSEALWTETVPYQHFIDIPMPHPPDDASGIFLHDYTSSGYTAGCIALPNAVLDQILAWLDPADSPHILISLA